MPATVCARGRVLHRADGRFPSNSRWSMPSAADAVPVDRHPRSRPSPAPTAAGCRSWPRRDDGACVFFEPRAGRLCGVHRTPGARLLPERLPQLPPGRASRSARDLRHAVALSARPPPGSAARPGPRDRRRPSVDHARRRSRGSGCHRRPAAAAAPGHADEPRWLRHVGTAKPSRRLNDRRLPPARSRSTASRRRRRRPLQWRPGSGDLSAQSWRHSPTRAGPPVGNRRRVRLDMPSRLPCRACLRELGRVPAGRPLRRSRGGSTPRCGSSSARSRRRATATPAPTTHSSPRSAQTDLLLRHARTDVGARSLSPLRRD